MNYHFAMEKNLKMLIPAACAVLALTACSSNDEANNSDKSSAPTSSESASVTKESSAMSTAESSAMPSESSTRGKEVSTTSADGTATLTGYATSLSDSDPKIVVTWKSDSEGADCDITLTREDPRGYLLDLYDSKECSGTQELTLVSRVAEDSDDVPGIHKVSLIGLGELMELDIDVPA